jgi:hypothetical protein
MRIMNASTAPPGQPSLPGMDKAGVGSAKEPLQVRIPVAIKRRFKAHAALRGIEPNELFVEVWDHYEQTHAARGGGQGDQHDDG